MKKHIYPLLFVVMTLFSTCKKVLKNVHDYYPLVKTTTATIMPDGTLQVSGEIVSQGNTGIYAYGICMDTIPHPDMISNQIIATQITGKTFTCTYSALDATKKYYFRAWAANSNGYAIGDDIAVTGVAFDTSLIPCHPQSQYLSLTGQFPINEAYTRVEQLEQAATGYEAWAYSDSHSVYINFGGQPVSGIYTTSEASDPGGTYVIMKVDGIITTGGAKVYVQQINNTAVDITICQDSCYANYGLSGDLYHYSMTTKFRIPL